VDIANEIEIFQEDIGNDITNSFSPATKYLNTSIPSYQPMLNNAKQQ
jgi:hypothetical protein